MRRPGPHLLGLVLLAGPALAQTAIDGTLENGTTGGPGRAERINLLQVQGGLDQVSFLEGVTGSFHFDLEAPGPYLLQVQSQGVTYMERVPPARGVATPTVTVYDTTRDTGELHVSVPDWVVILDGPTANVTRVFQLDNRTSPPRTIVGDPGAFRFDLPEEARLESSRVTSISMPLHAEPVETRDDRGKTIAYPLRPGKTQLEVVHNLAYPGSLAIRETLYHGAGTLNLIVVPATVEVEVEGLEARGRSERQGVSFLRFTGTDLPAGHVAALRIRGEARAPEPPAGRQAGGALEGEPRAVAPAPVRGWRKVGILLVPVLLLLGASIAALARKGPGPVRGARAAEPRPSPRAESLFDQIARLDEERARGSVGEEEHRARRAELRQAVITELGPGRTKKKTV